MTNDFSCDDPDELEFLLNLDDIIHDQVDLDVVNDPIERKRRRYEDKGIIRRNNMEGNARYSKAGVEKVEYQDPVLSLCDENTPTTVFINENDDPSNLPFKDPFQ